MKELGSQKSNEDSPLEIQNILTQYELSMIPLSYCGTVNPDTHRQKKIHGFKLFLYYMFQTFEQKNE